MTLWQVTTRRIPHSGIRSRHWPAVGASLFIASAVPTFAQEARVSILASARYEDNIRRFNDDARKHLPADGADEVFYLASEGVLATRIGGFTDVSAQASAGYTWFSTNSDLDAVNYSLSVRGDRSTPRNSLAITLEHLRQRIDLQELNANLVANQNLSKADLDVSQHVGGDLRIVGGASYLRSSTSIPERRRDNEQYALEGGVGYYSPSGNTIALAYRHSESRGLQDSLVLTGDLPLPFRARNVDKSIVLDIEYVHSPITRLDARIGYTDHDDKSVLNADFDGLVADATVTWSPRENLFIKPSVSRSYATENGLYNNGIKVTRYGIEANGNIGPLWAWSGSVSREIRTFRYDLAAPDPESLARTDRLTRISLAVDYPILERLRLGLQYNYFARSSTRNNFNFDSNAISFTISYSVFRR